jgi:cobalt-zinc-cadmium efflux system outer membrane protein
VTPHVISILLLAASSAAPVPASAEPSPAAPIWTEADALDALARGSPALADARAAEAAARGDLTQAGLVPNPTLSVGAGNLPVRANVTPSGNGNGIASNLVASVGIDQPIELGGKRGRRVAQARSALAAATASRADALRAATFELRRDFWDAVRARERRALAEQVLSRYAETIRITRARYESQDISSIDLEKVELEGAQHENELADAVAAQRSSVAQLLALVGPAAPPTVQVQGDLALAAPALDPERLVARARDARPDLAAARHAAEAARGAVRLAEAQAVPDLTVGASYAHSRAIAAGDNPDTLAFTVAVPLPLFHRNQGDIAHARAEADRAKHAAEALEAQVRQDVLGAHARYAAAAEKVKRYEGGALQRAERALSVAEKTWRAGDRSLLELLEAERTYIELRGDYLDTLFELREARLELERAVAAPLGEEER